MDVSGTLFPIPTHDTPSRTFLISRTQGNIPSTKGRVLLFTPGAFSLNFRLGSYSDANEKSRTHFGLLGLIMEHFVRLTHRFT